MESIVHAIATKICKLQFPTSLLDIKLYVHEQSDNLTSAIKDIDSLLNEIDFPVSNGIFIYFLNSKESKQESSGKYQFQNRRSFKCQDNDPPVKFRNFHEKEAEKYGTEFINSSVCYLTSHCSSLFRNWKCTFTVCPSMVDKPHDKNFCFNLTTIKEFLRRRRESSKSLPLDESGVYSQCTTAQPCSYVEYVINANSAEIRPSLFINTNFPKLKSLATEDNPGIKEFIDNFQNGSKHIFKWKRNFIVKYGFLILSFIVIVSQLEIIEGMYCMPAGVYLMKSSCDDCCFGCKQSRRWLYNWICTDGKQLF